MATLTQVTEEIAAKSRTLHDIFEQAGPDRDMSKVTIIEGDSSAKVAEIQRLNKELTELGKQRDELKGLESVAEFAERLHTETNQPVRGAMVHSSGKAAGQANGTGHGAAAERKSLGEAFVESGSYKGWSQGRGGQIAGAEVPAVGVKATFTTSGSTLTSYDRVPGIVLLGQQRLTVADLLAQGQTTMNTIRYVKEDTFTNAATTVAEGASKPEASWDTSEVDAPVRKIAVTAKVTDELFADFPMLRDYIDNRLRFMVATTEEAQLLTGDGNAPNITGLLQTSGIQTQAKGADTGPDAVYKAMTKVRFTGFFEPDGAVFHPNDWQDIRLLRTADGIYIWGPPMDAGPERIWSLPVVVTTAETENTVLVGAFRLGAQVWFREGVRVEATNSNEDDFKKNLIALRAEERLALTVYRPKAFCTVTGM